MIISGVGTNAIQWGDPDDFGTGPGRMTFTGNMFAAMPEDQFLLGNLGYFNGSVVQGTSPRGVDLTITVNFSTPVGLDASFVFPLTLINTPNVGTPEEQADIVFLPSLFPSTIFMLDGVPHTLKMTFGQSTAGGFTEIDRFFVYENQSASAELSGVLTADVSQVVPEPATWGLLCAGFAAFAWLRPWSRSQR
jgi:hypothetical protein